MLMKFSRLLFIQILIAGVILFTTLTFPQVMTTDSDATSLQSTLGYQNAIKSLTLEQQKQLAEYQQMLQQLSPEQRELLQQYQNKSVDAEGANEHIEYNTSGMSEQSSELRERGALTFAKGYCNYVFV